MSLTGKPSQVPVYDPPPKKPAVDLFSWIAAAFNKTTPLGTPPTFMMHRFMASDRDLAPLCRKLQTEVREPVLVFKIWQAVLPYGSAPRFAFVVPKKLPEEEELVTRMKSVLSESRSSVERMIDIIRLEGREVELYHEFGLLAPGEKLPKAKKSAPPPKEPPKQGLLARLKR